MDLPMYTKTMHSTPYPAIDPSRPELSAAGKVILITGGGAGYGSKLASTFAKAGATKIAILGRRSGPLESTKKEIESRYPGTKVLAFVADITDKDSTFRAFSETKEAFGPIDIFVSNAAYLPALENIKDANIDDYFKAAEINIKGTLVVSQAFLANAAENANYLAVSTAGIHLPAFPGGISAYNTTKLASAKMVEYVAIENPNIKVKCFHPGVMETDMYRKVSEKGAALPLDDIEMSTNYAVWLASPEGDFLRNRFSWSAWDVDELRAKKDEYEKNPFLLVLGLNGWPA
ncbi:hypothetical protein F5884DRAFT_362111 [Xylogone sp. PMI_703]|nr:hypothetical protein F5884DRAFT_362111 [Xylogone sp. PMI_703]